MTTAKSHSAKRVILRTVIIVAAALALFSAAWIMRWAYVAYLEFNCPVFTGAEFIGTNIPIDKIDKLTDSDRAKIKEILNAKNIPYKEEYGTTILVRSGKYSEASKALINSEYEFDGFVWRVDI